MCLVILMSMCAVLRTGECILTRIHHYSYDLPLNIHRIPLFNIIYISYAIAKYSWEIFHGTLGYYESLAE